MVAGSYAGRIQNCGTDPMMGDLYHVFATQPHQQVAVNLTWWHNHLEGGGKAYLTTSTMAGEPQGDDLTAVIVRKR